VLIIRSMKRLFKSFFLALITFLSHMILYEIVNIITGEFESKNTFWGGLVYALAISFWIYWILAYLFVVLTKEDSKSKAYWKALTIVLFGFIIWNMPYFLSGDYLRNTSTTSVIIFVALIPILAESKQLLLNKTRVSN